MTTSIAAQVTRLSTRASQVYTSLVEQIVRGALAPGQKLDEKILADQFGVSRTPVREALRELWARKLIQFQPRRGGVVAQFGPDELADMLEAECELDGLCARLASQRMTGLQKGELREIHERINEVAASGSLTKFFALNAAFHELICLGAGNETLATAASDLRFRLSPFRRPRLESDRPRLARAQAEHQAIFRSIVEGEAERAYEAMRAHNARVNAGVIRLLREGPRAAARAK